MARPSLKINIGNYYDQLLVKEKLEGRYYLCHCTCGNIKKVQASHLFHGRIKSCGCKLRKPKLNKSIAGLNRLFSSYKKNAEKRDLDFFLSLEDFVKLTSSNCHYCNEPPNQISSDSKKSEFSSYKYNGIDREDNKAGYMLGNCLPCCGICNDIKGTLTYNEFINKVRKINDNLCKNHL